MDYIDEEFLKIRDCARWLCGFLQEPKPRRIVKGEAIKLGFGQRHLKAARKIVHVGLLKNVRPANEDYWYLSKT